jgi:hypothetical protein
VVDATCRELEAAIEHPPGDARRLLLVAGWPLTREGDRAEAFLSAFDQCGPAVPYGYRRGRGGMGLYGAESSLSYGTVLAVPEAIVDLLKTPHETRWSGRYLAGPRIRGAKPNEAQVHALLRRAFPFLPTDVSKDEAEPSEQIVQARRDAEAASTYQPTGQDSRYDRAYAFADGAHVWVPGDADSIEVVRGLIGYAGSGPLLRVDVECGRRTTGTFLARIYGGVLDVTADRIEFCAYGGHRAVAIPMHRIVSVSGAVISRRGQRRGREAQPIWDLLTDEADLAPVKVDAKTTRQQVSSLIAQALRAGTPARACRPQDMITIAGVAVDPRPGPSDTLTQWVDRIAADLKASRRQTMAHLGLAPGNAPARRLKELSAYLDEATLTAVQDATDVSSGLITAMAERSRPPADQMTDLIREVIASRGADGKTLGWSFTIPPALVARLGGADKARAAARTAAARLGWSVTTHNYGRWPGGQNGELVAVSSQRRIWRKRPAEPAPLPDRPSSPLEEPACQCGAGPCESGPDGYRSVFFAPWGRADTNEVPEITPATDLRTLPPRYRNKYFAHHLFAQTRWYDSEDMPGHFDLGPFLDGAPLGPLADVAVYCTDPFAEFAGKAHGVGCQHAPEIGQHHLVVPLTDFLPLLPHTGRQMFEADWSQDRWCTWCGGFAVRRLGASQCAHYRKVLTVKRGRSTIRKAPESSW